MSMRLYLSADAYEMETTGIFKSSAVNGGLVKHTALTEVLELVALMFILVVQRRDWMDFVFKHA
jgi:hypothetical protein